MLVVAKNVVSVRARPPVIGAKFTGRAQFLDTQHGVYWETLPEMTRNAEMLQKALLLPKPLDIIEAYAYAIGVEHFTESLQDVSISIQQAGNHAIASRAAHESATVSFEHRS